MVLKRISFLIVLLASAIALAQQPQTQAAPNFAVNAKYTNGVAPGYAPTKGSGLTLNLGPGTTDCAGTLVEYVGGTLTMTNSTTNYVYLDPGSSCAPTTSTSTFTSAHIWVAKVVTSGGVITSIDDVRTSFTAPGTGAGSVINFSAGDLSPLFTTSVATSTTTPALSFTLSTFAAHKFYGNNTGSTAAPAAESVTDADLSLSDVTTNNSSTSNHGFLKKLDNDATHFMDGQGNWNAPSVGSLSGSVSCSQMPALTGDVTTSAGSCATTIAAVDKRRVCAMIIGADNASAALADADIAPQSRQCFIAYAATVVEIEVAANGGTPNVVVAKNHAGSLTDLLSSALATASAGAIACSNTGGTTGLDGATTCSSTLQNTSLAAGDYLETHTATAGGTAKRMSIFVTYTVN